MALLFTLSKEGIENGEKVIRDMVVGICDSKAPRLCEVRA